MSGSLSARQSRTNQPPGSDAVAVSLALARPTTEWHQHIQNRRSDPCIAAQISRGPTGMGRPRCREGAQLEHNQTTQTTKPETKKHK